ncbi:MAG: hypothetical protein ACRDD9_17580 [Shewanella sp.]
MNRNSKEFYEDIKSNLFDWKKFLDTNQISFNRRDNVLKHLRVELDDIWRCYLIKSNIFLDEDENYIGFDIVRKSDIFSENIIFMLTTFDDMDVPPSVWMEKYSSKHIADSTLDSWQFATSGVFFFPESKSWFSFYMDCIEGEVVLFCANESMLNIVELENNIKEYMLYKIQ